jgi:hypothetical protein
LPAELPFEFELSRINLYIKKSKDSEWVKEKGNEQLEFAQFERDKSSLKLEDKLISMWCVNFSP